MVSGERPLNKMNVVEHSFEAALTISPYLQPEKEASRRCSSVCTSLPAGHGPYQIAATVGPS